MSKALGKRILHVDDREENRYIVSKILRGAGFDVVEGKTGKQALELAASLPDLIILDVRLPDMLGYEVSKRLKSNPYTSGIPIIQLSASFISNESKVQALDSGADQYLTQPVEPPVLVASVKALLRIQRAEALSRLSARQWQTTFDALSEGIGLIGEDQQILRCNRAMSELLNRSYSLIEGHNCRAILNEALHVPFESMPDLSKRQTIEIRSGSRWYRITIDPVTSENNAQGSILVIAEITPQKLAEEALLITEQLAATGRLAHSIAHEINNPLAAVTNLLYLLKPFHQEGSDAAKYLTLASQELNRVSRITKQTLSFHRDTSLPVEVSVSDLMDNVLDLYRAQIVEKEIDLQKRFESRNSIIAFPGQIRQVFSNLVGNALDASQVRGKLLIHIYNSQSWSGTALKGARIVICDNGKGIIAENQKRIFDAFFTTKEQKGSGLGLWLSLGIVNAHHGVIRVRSSRNPKWHGSRFSVFLPFAHPIPPASGKKTPAETVA